MYTHKVPIEEKIASLQTAPNRWPIEVHACLVAFVDVLIRKTSFTTDEIRGETARFMDVFSSCPETFAAELKTGMTQEEWPMLLSSMIESMHTEFHALSSMEVPESRDNT